jgi:hypothetical protein
MTPQLSPSDNRLVHPTNSPFSSAPGTTAPYAKITNFNIALAGTNVFQDNQTFAFESYNENLRPNISLNGGAHSSIGISSGSVSKQMFESGYSYYYVDLSRHASVEFDNQTRNVQLLFKSLSSHTMDYYITLFFEKNFNINISTGQNESPK